MYLVKKEKNKKCEKTEETAGRKVKGVLAVFLVLAMLFAVGCGSAAAAQGETGATGEIENPSAASGDEASSEAAITNDAATLGTVHFDVENLVGLDSHASVRVQIANNGSLPPYSGSETKQAVQSGSVALTGIAASDIDAAQDTAEEKGDTHSSIDQYIDLTSTNNILTALCTDDCTYYSTTAYRIINTGDTEVQFAVQEDVKALDDYYWNGHEWRDSFYDDHQTWSVDPGSYIEFTLPVNPHQGIFHNKVRGTYVKLWAVQTPQGPDHFKVTDGNIVTEFNVDKDALQLVYDEDSIRATLLPAEYVPTLANILNNMAQHGYVPPLYMTEKDEPEDLPILYVFEWYPQNGKFEIEVTKN
ncbi:MAG: hypothetical protein LBR14_00060 [Clostridiales Family XIII bacterium]|jgi:hypothetical protein|nr:hypothetical protein [Clostridiales Family XIII bacterium]